MDPRGVLRTLGNKILVFLLLRMRVWVKGYVIDRRLGRDSRNPGEVQKKLLLSILNFHRNTEYGLLHGFAGISCVEEFRRRVGINDYEDLRPWFEKQEKERTYAINAEHPILYTLTSGTTGKPKLIPVLKATLKKNRNIQNFYFNYLFRARPRVADGRIFTIVSPAVEGHTPHSQTPFGATTGHMYASAPRLARRKYVIPPEIFGIRDYDLRFHLILRLAIQTADITYMTSANPTTFTRVIQLLNEKWDTLLDELEAGGFSEMERLTPEQQDIVQKNLLPNANRAKKLRELRINSLEQRIRFRDIWPNIQAVGMWTGGSCSIFFERIKDEFAPETLIRDVGYHSSEFRGSTPIFENTTAGVPTFREHFFEFVPRDSWDSGEKKFLGLADLRDGEEYYIFITTESGLYRYNMNDVVRVEGFFNQVPLLRFMQKGKGVTNITGEKLYENQVIHAVQRMEERYGIDSAFYMMIADAENAKYTLFYEPLPESAELLQDLSQLGAAVEAGLSEVNIEYDAKRKSSRLAPLQILPLKAGSYELYKRDCIAAGQRESQFKIIALHYKTGMQFDFNRLVRKIPQEPARKPIREKHKLEARVQVS